MADTKKPEVPAAAAQPTPLDLGAQPPQLQYVVMQQSLQGVGGWLIFFMICFGFAALSYIMLFFMLMPNISTAPSVIGLIFSPILAAGYIASIVTIAMQKRLGKLLTWTTLAISALYGTANAIATYAMVGDAAARLDSYMQATVASQTTQKSLPLLVGSIIAMLTVHGLVALYFMLAKRVKETLVN